MILDGLMLCSTAILVFGIIFFDILCQSVICFASDSHHTDADFDVKGLSVIETAMIFYIFIVKIRFKNSRKRFI